LSEHPREILVINVSRIGDTLLATPALRAIATAFPQARITCLAHPKRAEILLHQPCLTRVGRITKRRARWMGRLGVRRYDLAFVYGNDKPLIEYALRVARRVVAFRQDDPSIDNRLHRCVAPPPFQSMHSVRLLLMLPAALDIAPAGLRLSYQVTLAEAARARAELSRRLGPHPHPLVGLQVASFPTKAYRDWPVEHFMALCERIVASHPRAHFLIFGGAEERARTEALQRRLGAASTLLAGKLTLRETAAFMQRLDLYIGVDTGPTHIMSAFDVPLVALYHGYSPSRLIGPLEHPCLFAVDHPRPKSEATPDTPMAEISVDAVWQSVQAALVAGLHAAQGS
jgi:heptosyltransferase-3